MFRVGAGVRWLIWAVGLFALAVGLTVAARYNTGLVLLALPTHRIELSANLAVILLLLLFGAFYVVVRTASAALAMPRRARVFRQQQEQARARASLLEGLKAYFEGRFGRAERAARAAAAVGEAPALALVVAARAAHELRSFQARDEYLQRMETEAPQEDYLRAMTRAELLLDERRYLDALQVLGRLPDKHTAALKLELRAHQLAKNWDQMLALLPQLEKRKVFEPIALEQVQLQALVESLKRKALDATSLSEAWDRLPADRRKHTRVAAAAAQCFIALGACEEAHRIVEDSLDADWDASLLALYTECVPRDARHHLLRAEAWLREHPDEPLLLLALGQLCVQQELWGKARSYLEASLAVEPSHTAYLQLAALLERTGKTDEAAAAYRKALDLALAQLEEAAGGRREPAI
jgi:HemY protein